VNFFRRIISLTWIAALGLGCQASAQEQDKRSLFKDPEDGKLDASEWLLERKGFLPVPILITEPAVGYGAGAALLFFRESIGDAVTKAKESGGIARPDVNLDFYGTNGTDSTRDLKLGYNVEGWISTQQLMRRLGESENFIGPRWIYLDLDTRFDPSRPDPVFAPGGRAVKSSGLGLTFEHDSRDNFFTPSSGWKGYLESMLYSPDIGSDNTYQTYRAYAFSYFPLKKEFILGVRADGRAARGDVPFYQLPFIELRGIPVARYQDENAAVAEAELRWDVTPRWALIGFLGAGRAWGSTTNFSDADTAKAWGLGLRYLIARRLGLYMGADIARGPEDTAFYIQAGSAWR
jgi:hypothetical protein